MSLILDLWFCGLSIKLQTGADSRCLGEVRQSMDDLVLYFTN